MPQGTSSELGQYLRSRRSASAPPRTHAGGRVSRRRVPGLRRQEAAEAANISVEYYTRLEQGRAPRPSRAVLGSLSDALGLSRAERDHLFRLAGELPPEPSAPDVEIRPGLRRLLGQLSETVPVTVHDGRLELLARNAAAVELLGPVPEPGHHRRNIVCQGYSPVAQEVLGEDGAQRYASWATAELRAAMIRYPRDEHLRSVHADLMDTSAAFRGNWAEGLVRGERSGVKRLRHPTRGWQTFQSEMLHDAERDHWVVIYAPVD